MYQFLSWFRSRKYHEIPEFDNQNFIQLIYVRDTTENFVPCENYAYRFTTEKPGLMQQPKSVLELLTMVSVLRTAFEHSGGRSERCISESRINL